MLFQLLLAKCLKSELSSCLLKVDHVIKSSKKPINLFLFVFIFLEIRFHWCIQTMIQYVALSDLEY